MPEDVSLRCNMIGTHILLLKGGVPHQTVGRLEIISPSDTGTPIVTWDRDKMRRTGKTGNLVFIEIGRRCTGGPGLVWMYAGFEEAHALRETLHRLACGIITVEPLMLNSTLLPPLKSGHLKPFYGRPLSCDMYLAVHLSLLYTLTVTSHLM